MSRRESRAKQNARPPGIAEEDFWQLPPESSAPNNDPTAQRKGAATAGYSAISAQSRVSTTRDLASAAAGDNAIKVGRFWQKTASALLALGLVQVAVAVALFISAGTGYIFIAIGLVIALVWILLVGIAWTLGAIAQVLGTAELRAKE